MPNLEEVGFSESFKIRTNEIDLNRQVKIPALIQLLQEASMSNAVKLKVSIWDLEDESLSWVLTKKEINIIRLPMLGETINVTTYPSGLERLFAYRDFIVTDEQDNTIVTASSTWILMNTKTRKLVVPELDIPFPTDVEYLDRPSFNLRNVTDLNTKTSFDVHWHDLDWNQHVNNVFILKCVLEGLPDELLQNGKIKEIRIQFKAESFWKDKLISQYQKIDNHKSNHSIIRDQDDKVIALAEIVWN